MSKLQACGILKKHTLEFWRDKLLLLQHGVEGGSYAATGPEAWKKILPLVATNDLFPIETNQIIGILMARGGGFSCTVLPECEKNSFAGSRSSINVIVIENGFVFSC